MLWIMVTPRWGILKVQSLKFKVQSKNLEEDFSRR
jgi:hypothetical protein